MMNTCNPVSIYRYTNLINGKVYIGSTIDVEGRIKQHKQKAKTSNIYFYLAVRKYGWDNFKFEVIEEGVCPLIRNDRENFWIRHHNSLDPHHGYNQKNADNTKMSDEIKNKISIGGTGLKRSDEFKKNMAKLSKGRIKSDETREKLSKALTGKKRPEDVKKRISDKLKGREVSDATKEKMSKAQMGEKGHNFGKKFSDATREKMRESARNRCIREGRNLRK